MGFLAQKRGYSGPAGGSETAFVRGFFLFINVQKTRFSAILGTSTYFAHTSEQLQTVKNIISTLRREDKVPLADLVYQIHQDKKRIELYAESPHEHDFQLMNSSNQIDNGLNHYLGFVPVGIYGKIDPI